MSDRISTKAGIFESGEKDVYGVQYKDGRLISCRNNKLEEYAVADGTEVICDRAFMNMKELKSITLPSSLKAIGESAFSGCKALADINIPEGVSEIRQATFRDCDALAALELPASVTEIEKFAFGRGLTTLVVNAPEMKIDRYAFMNARDFSRLMVPADRTNYYINLLAEKSLTSGIYEIEDNNSTLTNKTNNIMEEEKKLHLEELISTMNEFHEDELYSIYIRPKIKEGEGLTIHCDTLSIEEDYDEGGFCSYDSSNSKMEKWVNSLGISDEKSLAELMLANHKLLITEYIKLCKEDREDIELFSKLAALNWQMEYLKKFNCLNYIKEFNLFDSSMEEYLNPDELRQEAENRADDCGFDGDEYLPD